MYADIEQWDTEEGTVRAYNTSGEEVIQINALQNKHYQAKWGERYTPGRAWFVYFPDGTYESGHANDLRQAKRDALAVLNEWS